MKIIKILLNGQIDDYEVRSLHKHNNVDDIHAQKSNAGICEIINITLCGALILLPRGTVIPDAKLKITIPSGAMNQACDTVIDSEIRWSDVQRPSEQIRLGLMFTGMNRSDRRELKKLLLTLESPSNARLPCRLAAA